MPDAAIDTVETGTRHRTADRVARQSGLPVVSVSASMSTIALYLDQGRHLVEHSDQILSRANQALQTLERYRARLWQVTNRLSSLEVQDQVTVKDFVLVAQRLEMVRRLDARGERVRASSSARDGRLLTLQLHELRAGIDELRWLLETGLPAGRVDRLRPGRPGIALAPTELLDPLTVARAVGLHRTTSTSTPGSPRRGFRQMAQINRLPTALGERLIEHFGNLQALFARQQRRAAGGRRGRRGPGPGDPRRPGPAGRIGVHRTHGLAVSHEGSSAAGPAWPRRAERWRSRCPAAGSPAGSCSRRASGVRSRPASTPRACSPASFLRDRLDRRRAVVGAPDPVGAGVDLQLEVLARDLGDAGHGRSR